MTQHNKGPLAGPALPPLPAWSSSATTRWCHRIGVVSLLLYLFTWVLSLDISRSFEPILMLVFLVALFVQPGRRRAFNDPLWWLLGLWLLLQAVTLPPAMAMFPEDADGQIKSMRGLTKVFLILPIAWIMAGSTRIALWALTALIVGMVTGSLLTGESPATLYAYMQSGQRPTLGFKNWQHAGVCAGVILIAQACFAWRFFQTTACSAAWHRWLLRMAFVLVALWAVTAWAITMTRAAWLGIAVVIVVALTGGVIALMRKDSGVDVNRKYLLFGAPAAVLIFIVTGAFFGDQIVSRIFRESHVIAAILSGELANVPMSSIGFRIHAWYYASQLIAEQPWFGWGPQSHIPLLLQSTHPVEGTTLGAIADTYNLRHFHSSYLTLLVANGFLGALTYLGVIVAVGTAAFKSWRRGDMPHDVMAFLTLFFVFWAVVNVFESYIDYRTGIYVIGAVGGMAYSYGLRRQLIKRAGHAGQADQER